MYQNDSDALRARMDALVAELNAERKHREAADAETAAAHARVHELELRLSRQPVAHQPSSKRPMLIAGGIAAMALVAGLVLVLVRSEAERPVSQQAMPPVVLTPTTPPPEAPTPRGGHRPISAGEILAVQRQHAQRLRACFDLAVRKNPALSDLTVEIHVTMSDEGGVREVRVERAANPELERCLTRDISTWRLPPLGQQTFSFPVMFRAR